MTWLHMEFVLVRHLVHLFQHIDHFFGKGFHVLIRFFWSCLFLLINSKASLFSLTPRLIMILSKYDRVCLTQLYVRMPA